MQKRAGSPRLSRDKLLRNAMIGGGGGEGGVMDTKIPNILSSPPHSSPLLTTRDE